MTFKRFFKHNSIGFTPLEFLSQNPVIPFQNFNFSLQGIFLVIPGQI